MKLGKFEQNHELLGMLNVKHYSEYILDQYVITTFFNMHTAKCMENTVRTTNVNNASLVWAKKKLIIYSQISIVNEILPECCKVCRVD